MNEKIKAAIVGYGNLGKGVELAIKSNSDFELVCIFTKRNVKDVKSETEVVSYYDIEKYKGKIDIMIMCGGSATDLPEQTPYIASMFNTIDTYDNHILIPEYFNKIDEITKKAETSSLISTGWDPGLFSLNRLLGQSIFPEGKNYTFWGEGISQGHSDALRRVNGVKDGVQYTIPIKSALNAVRTGTNPDFTAGQKHKRVCYVVAEQNADKDKIVHDISSMPYYFADYDTTVNFISEDELKKNHSKMPHGGFVIQTATTNGFSKHVMEFNLKLENNPEFTAFLLIAYARATVKMHKSGHTGALTVFDVPLGYLSQKTPEQLRKQLL